MKDAIFLIKIIKMFFLIISVFITSDLQISEETAKDIGSTERFQRKALVTILIKKENIGFEYI
jgi:hypothetical protein